MNIWALDKDNSIKHLLLLLEQDVGPDAFTLPDAESLHHKSIRLGSTRVLATAYLYTYGQNPDRYGLHLEYPYNPELNTSEQEDMYEDLTYDAVLEILMTHFNWHHEADEIHKDANR
jgi:hypothetical protein